jgi:hypothetical protein
MARPSTPVVGTAGPNASARPDALQCFDNEFRAERLALGRETGSRSKSVRSAS